MEVHPKIKEMIDKVTAKRARAVIDHIVSKGSVNTEELKTLYGYNHPPRAARDVRECGIPLVTTRVEGTDGRMIGAYTFGDPDKVEQHKLAGRKVFSKALKKLLLEKQDSRCALTGERFEDRYLSIDHRVPYEVAGDTIAGEDDPDSFMLISGTAQRQKSWSCEHCTNLLEIKDPEICHRCYWASPEDYNHVEMEQRRRITLNWSGQEIAQYEKLVIDAQKKGVPVDLYIKGIVTKI